MMPGLQRERVIPEHTESLPRFFHVKTIWRTTMATTSRGRAQDRERVAGGQDHEVKYEAKKENVSEDAVKTAIKNVGNSRDKVEADLAKKS